MGLRQLVNEWLSNHPLYYFMDIWELFIVAGDKLVCEKGRAGITSDMIIMMADPTAFNQLEAVLMSHLRACSACQGAERHARSKLYRA